MQSFRKFIVALLVLGVISVFSAKPINSAFAQSATSSKIEVVNAFKYFENVLPNISRPTVLEVSFNTASITMPVFAVYNLTSSEFEPHLFSVSHLETGSQIETNGTAGSLSAIHDGNLETFKEFPLTNDENRAEITFRYEKPITASSLSFTLDNYVALPQKISVRSVNDGGVESVVLAPIYPTQGRVVFPETMSSVWRVTFDYVQPLRITELNFNELSSGQVTSQGLRFLAQPGGRYEVYFDADRFIQSTKKEAGDLSSNVGVVSIRGSSPVLNPKYIPADSDKDSVPDLTDNCISAPNVDQKDVDGNGRGDACEDYDRDGVQNINDNCPETPNRVQEDTDVDGVGDICDSLDNRVTERMPWLPWAGMGIAVLVILGLFVVTIKHRK